MSEHTMSEQSTNEQSSQDSVVTRTLPNWIGRLFWPAPGAC